MGKAGAGARPPHPLVPRESPDLLGDFPAGRLAHTHVSESIIRVDTYQAGSDLPVSAKCAILRYVSRRDGTNKERIEEIQRLLPPAAGVRSRTGYASLDELAALLGTNRSHVIQWKKGSEPSRRHRERLAELSGGRYSPDDFVRRRPGSRRELAALEDRVRALEELAKERVPGVDLLGEAVERLREGMDALERRVEVLEHRRGRTDRRSAG